MFKKLSPYLTKRNLFWSAIGILLIVAVYVYFIYREHYPSTDDAYVQANVVHIATQVSGPVAAVYVNNNQFVKKGDLLFTIDPRPFQNARDRAYAGLKLAWQQMYTDMEAINIVQAQISQMQAQETVAEKNYARISTLVKDKQFSVANGDDARAQLDVAKANLLAAQKQLRQAQQRLGDAGEKNVQIMQAKTNITEAELNLGYTKVFAPTDGYITNFEIRTGTMVIMNRTIFQLVESQDWWVYANYKETEMLRIKAGQSATIVVDLYPEHIFHGVVDSVSHGSGVAFSLLPPENATGNWVKITQRFPVKVKILDPDPKYPLRVGASSTVRIDTVHPFAQAKVPHD